MQLSVSSGKNGIIQRATFLVFGDSGDHSTDYPLADMTASANRWVQRVSLWIWKASGIWDIDDSNQTTLTSATATLVDNQQDYQIPTSTFKIKRVEVQDISGNWYLLGQLDETEIPGALPEFYKTKGMPRFYRIEGNSFFLYPAPDTTMVTATAGLRIYVSREFLTFSVPASYTTADVTEPGFDEQFHDIIYYGIAYDYVSANGTADHATRLRSEIEQTKMDLFQHYGAKDADRKVVIRPQGMGSNEYI